MNFDSYYDPDKNIPGWSDEVFEIQTSCDLNEGEIIKIDDEYFVIFECVTQIDDDKHYVLADTRDKNDSAVDHFLNGEEVIFL